MHGSIDHKIYIQPLGILRGCVASEAVTAGTAQWLAGGPLAFTLVKIIFRCFSTPHEEKIINLFGLDGYLMTLTPDQQKRISQILKKITAIRPPLILADGKELTWEKPLIQGIVNVTPDSFSDGGQYEHRQEAIRHAYSLIKAGADIIDIGGESTRPGAKKVTIEQELDRVIPVIDGLKDVTVPLSIDTRNGAVMEKALAAGAAIINDVSALSHDEKSMGLMANKDCPVILMHAQNNPDVMQINPEYDNVVFDVYDYLESRIKACAVAGIVHNRIVIDPGIGFGKTVAHNIALMAKLSLFHGLGVPLLLGVSRKSFIGAITCEENPQERLAGSLAFGQMGYDQGVQILRVHDVSHSRRSRSSWMATGKN